MQSADILIIGSGIAGLSLAVKASSYFPAYRIVILSKDDFGESNTKYAQGGIAIAIDRDGDSFQRHIEDTLRAGDGLCDRVVVEKVVTEGPDRLEELLSMGIGFDREPDGTLALGQEGGHTARRIIHYKDATGNRISEGLIAMLAERPNVQCIPWHFATDLLMESDGKGGEACRGAVVIDVKNQLVKNFTSRITVLATGGAGQVYATTTNPLIATGDGIAMASRAGATMRDMEFVQFHPTAFYCNSDNPSFLISEAVRGYGAFLRRSDGERFVFNYDVRGELASRDIISKAIHNEIASGGEESVFLDCRHLPAEELRAHFPTIYERCLQKGFDITKQPIPVTPAAHYMCGGIAVNGSGQTSIENLYACGECACTGLHGANRLASNSLLEALVFAHEIFLHVSQCIESVALPVPHMAIDECTSRPEEQNWIDWQKKYIRQLMSRDAGIVRYTESLKNALQQLEYLSVHVDILSSQSVVSPALYELRNMLEVSRLIIRHSLDRNENRGTFYNADLAFEK